jgi:hypothetical protein
MALQQLGQPPQLGRHPGGDHHPGAAAAGDGRAPERHVAPFRQQRVVDLGQGLDLLGHRPGFAGEGGLVDPQRPRLGQAQVGGEQVARSEQHQVAGHQLGRGKVLCSAAAPDVHHRSGHRLERGHRPLARYA